MRTIKVRGIIIKENFIRESDKQLTILTKEHGKIITFAKGAKNAKSKFSHATQLFCYCDFVLFNGKTFLTVAQVELIHSFHNISRDYERLVYAQYILEVCDKILLQNLLQSEDITSEEMLYLMIKTLNIMCKEDLNRSLKLICIIFKFKFLQINGLAPETITCSLCHEDLQSKSLIFFGTSGAICSSCTKRHNDIYMKVSYTALYAINYILTSKINDIFKFKVSEDVLREIWSCIDIFMKYHCDVYIKSRELILKL